VRTVPEPFTLQFPAAQIPRLAQRYTYADDSDARQAGQRIAAGDFSRENLRMIVAWKSSRSTGLLAKNSDADIADALRLAVGAETERAAVAVLPGLRGVEIPVASAVMTAIHPERYTILDYRALEALGVSRSFYTIDFYLEYLACCRGLARKRPGGLRELDRAMWQWSKNGGTT